MQMRTHLHEAKSTHKVHDLSASVEAVSSVSLQVRRLRWCWWWWWWWEWSLYSQILPVPRQLRRHVLRLRLNFNNRQTSLTALVPQS